MLPEVKIILESEELYQDFYLALSDKSEDTIPGSFSFDHHIRVQWIDRVNGESSKVEKDHQDDGRVTAFLDDHYRALKDYKGSGIKSIWYNPGNEVVDDPMPLQDVDISDFEVLKDARRLLHKPSLEQSLAWLEEWEVPENIRRHSKVVARSAYVLAVRMREKGIAIDPILAHRAGLLHDIDKIETLDQSYRHGSMGADFLVEHGYPEIGKIVRDHIMSTIVHPDAQSRTWENKLVFFCDKLVEGDELVPFNQRLEALKGRYPYFVEKMAQAEPYIWDLSDQICDVLGIGSHEGLIEMLKKCL